jgi:glycosyltransferase involved in cell wall biosynthesis
MAKVHIAYSDRHFLPFRQKPATEWFSCAQIAAQTYKTFKDAGHEVTYGDQVPTSQLDLLWTNRVARRCANVGRMVYFASVAHYGFMKAALRARAIIPRDREDMGNYSSAAIFEYTKALLRSDKVVIIGNQTISKTFIAQLPRLHSRIHTIDCGVDFNHFEPSEGVERLPYFAHVATQMSFRKGTDIVVQAWPSVAKRLPESRLVLLGREGDYSLPAQFASRADVIHIGAFSGAEKNYRDLLSQCRWIVLPSIAEGQAGTLLEGMSCGCVPVCTPQTGIDAGRYGGVSVIANNVQSLSDGMVRAATAWRTSLPSSVREATKHFHDWKLFRSTCIDIAEVVLGRPPLADTPTLAAWRSLRYVLRQTIQ